MSYPEHSGAGGYAPPQDLGTRGAPAPRPIDTGGSAFPIGSGDMRDPQGMTLRDYFIAHAPAEPQAWFQPVVPPRLAAEKVEGGCFSLSNQAEIDAWEFECAKQRYVQWPAAWADEIMKARKA